MFTFLISLLSILSPTVPAPAPTAVAEWQLQQAAQQRGLPLGAITIKERGSDVYITIDVELNNQAVTITSYSYNYTEATAQLVDVINDVTRP